MNIYRKPEDIIRYKEDIALEIFLKDLKEFPSLMSIKEKYLQDTIYTLKFLATSLEVNEPSIFANYMKWFGSLAFHLRFSLDGMKRHFELSLKVLYSILDVELVTQASSTFQIGIEAFEDAFLHADNTIFTYDAFLKYLIQMESEKAYQIVLKEIEKGMSIKDVYLNLFQPTLYKVGELWHQRVISVAKEHYITAAIQNMIGRLYSKLFSYREKPKYSITAVCAGDELHEIGMRMVADFFEISNWDSYFLGSNIPVSIVINHLLENPTDLLAISATTSQHLFQVKHLIEAVKSNPQLKQVKIIVGGKLFNETPNLWKSLSADGHAIDAEQAVLLGTFLVGEEHA